MFKTNLSKSIFGCFVVLGLFVLSACSGAGNAVTESTATQEVTQIVETPTFLPTVTPEPTATVAIVLDPEVVGPVEMTGEEYKLLHTQNVIDKMGTMCDPETYAARNELVIDLRQRTMDKLAAETSETAPENTFESYLAWLYQLKASGKIDNDKFWEFAGNMLITNEEIKTLAESDGPINTGIEYPNNVTPGINFGKEEILVSVKLPDGSTVEQKIFDFAQGKVLAMVPADLMPGDKLGRGIGYVILGGENSAAFTIVAMTFGDFANKIARDYFGNENTVAKMPQEWQGYHIPGYKSVSATQYYNAANFYNWGSYYFDNGNIVKVANLGVFDDKWLRIAFAHQFSDWILDPNGVFVAMGQSVTIGQK